MPGLVAATPAGETRSGAIRLAQAQAVPPAATAAPAPAVDDEPVGNVATLTGRASVTRNKTSSPLKVQDDIYRNDVLQTAANSTLGITFNDATTFNLTANARIAVDDFIYEDGGKQNAALFDIARGTVAFAAAALAKSGNMKISTPTATLGIRGTTGLVEVPEGASTANNVAIKLYPDADGKVGRIEVNDRAGVRLGFLTQGASGFTIRPGAGGRFGAVPLLISPQQALRDQGIVRQVHAAQNVGRQIVSRQRALRRANPGRNNPRNNPARPPGAQRPNGPSQRPGVQPAPQNRPGQVQPPDNLQRQPNGPRLRPGLPPGLQNRPAPLQRRAPAPRVKKERR
jgi:hypothetical protein